MKDPIAAILVILFAAWVEVGLMYLLAIVIDEISKRNRP